MRKRHTPRSFVPGPPIVPTDTFFLWLQSQKQRVRLPLSFQWDETALFSYSAAFLGIGDYIAQPSLSLSLDDSHMGISLMDHLRSFSDPKSPHTTVWIEGYWQKVNDPLARNDSPWTFMVRDVLAYTGELSAEALQTLTGFVER